MGKDKLKELAAYSKEEIIEAIGLPHWFDEDLVDYLIIELKHLKRTRAIEQHDEAWRAESVALDAYLAWQKKMITEYGDGERVQYNQVPLSEIQRGLELEKAWNDARKKERKTRAKVKDLLRV